MTYEIRDVHDVAMIERRGMKSGEEYLLTDPEVNITTGGSFWYKLSGSVDLMLGKISKPNSLDNRLNNLKHL